MTYTKTCISLMTPGPEPVIKRGHPFIASVPCEKCKKLTLNVETYNDENTSGLEVCQRCYSKIIRKVG